MSEDRPLYDAGPGSKLASLPENQRVRAMLREELGARVATGTHGTGPTAYGRARGEFAADWVRIGERQGLLVPGQDQRRHYDSPEEALKAHVDAARTRLRQFQEGHNEFTWILVGIETVICDRHGLAYPPGAYETQGRLL